MVFRVINQDYDSRCHFCVSNECELEMSCYLEGKILSAALFVLGVSVPGGIRPCFVLCMLEDVHSYFPHCRGRKKKSQ